MSKLTLEQRAERELKRVQKKLRAGDMTNDELYGAQQALCWLLKPEETAAPSKVFPIAHSA